MTQTKTEFNLSEKAIHKSHLGMKATKEDNVMIFQEKDVKEFMRLLKEDIKSKYGTYKSTKVTLESIDKLAGDKLI